MFWGKQIVDLKSYVGDEKGLMVALSITKTSTSNKGYVTQSTVAFHETVASTEAV